MAKSQRSKVMRRWRSLKREHLQNVKVNSDLHDLNQKLEATIQNRFQRPIQPKNKFLHPSDPTAQIPKFKPQPIVDFRSQSLPYTATQFVGARRKPVQEIVFKPEPDVEEEIEMDDQQQNEQVQHDEADDLINAMEGVRVKSKREVKRENKARAMEEIIPLTKNKQIKKNRRKEQPARKSKKLITF
ncbi:unnamed protein product (macronuclear) [Paramecium tetraurelia]|uniref:Ribosome biogenesis protein NOP53 n=1 Tax=Paramecium tetraurelia TaxID=5888 RepID=A0DJ04_PARTE|nr:uncharacterized protein GSPATT00017378001 [Paramecium tetraurelia]CAK83021.1 unnamed protein product [Paramecium tetraurelia]|eukprot:XP_001450418.1 hypothetical protein (macronuclear) [Paramecium tetraurelia strain d4-2]